MQVSEFIFNTLAADFVLAELIVNVEDVVKFLKLNCHGILFLQIAISIAFFSKLDW